VNKKLKLDDLPELPGYITVGKAAEKYGVHKGTIYYMIFNSQKIRSAHRVLKGGGDPRPIIVVSKEEVDRVMTQRAASGEADVPVVSDLPAQKSEWNRRVKAWATQIGWTQTTIKTFGPAPRPMVEAYLAANPEDPKPGS
jgi:hypothetical protein